MHVFLNKYLFTVKKKNYVIRNIEIMRSKRDYLFTSILRALTLQVGHCY